MDDVQFKVYGDDQSGVILRCREDYWYVVWPEGVDLKELDKAAATHYWEVHSG